MKTKYICMLLALASIFSFARGYAQGTIQVSFEGDAMRSGQLLAEYHESGVAFTAYGTGPYDWGFSGWVSGVWWQRADNGNGSAYLTPGSLSTVTVSSLSGLPMSLMSVDLSEEGSWSPFPVTVHFIGYHPDGSTVTADFTTDGVIDGTGPLADFQTFYFGSAFTGLSRVEIPGSGWAMDNLVITIPEPSAGALVIMGGVILYYVRIGRARRPNQDRKICYTYCEWPNKRIGCTATFKN
jgi:hypothetical protein